MQIKSKEASQFTYIYVCIKKKQIGIKQNTHFGKIAFNQIDYKKQ